LGAATESSAERREYASGSWNPHGNRDESLLAASLAGQADVCDWEIAGALRYPFQARIRPQSEKIVAG